MARCVMALYDVTIGGSGGVKIRTSRHRVNEADVLRAVGEGGFAWGVSAEYVAESIVRDRAVAKRWGRSCSWHGEHGDAQRGQVVTPSRGGGGLDCVTPTTIARVERVTGARS